MQPPLMICFPAVTTSPFKGQEALSDAQNEVFSSFSGHHTKAVERN